MNLHLTINQKLIDSIPIDPERREDKEYLEDKKLDLQLRHKQLLDKTQTRAEFYLDPLYIENPAISFNVF